MAKHRLSCNKCGHTWQVSSKELASGLVSCPGCQVVGTAAPKSDCSPKEEGYFKITGREESVSKRAAAESSFEIPFWLYALLFFGVWFVFNSGFRHMVISIVSGGEKQSIEASSSSAERPITKREQKSIPVKNDRQSPNAPMPDDQYFDYLKTKFTYESDVAKRVELMQKYINSYSQGSHIGEAKALIEKAETDLTNWRKEQSQGGVMVECKVQLGSGQTALVQGYIQIFESAYSLGQLIQAADSRVSENSKALGEDFYVRDFGENLRSLLSSQRLVAQAQINNGQVVFRGLPANKSLIVYGAGMAGLNFVGYCDSFMSVGGRTLTIQPDSLTHFCRTSGFIDGDLTATVLMTAWKPVE